MTLAISVDWIGLEDFAKKLANLADTTPIKKAVLAGALMVESDAKLSIAHGVHSGRVYGNHIASAPGEAPATDHGMLVNSIQHWTSSDGLSVEVGSKLDYAVDLEYGTKRMAARPFIDPAVEKNRAAIVERIQKSIGAGK